MSKSKANLLSLVEKLTQHCNQNYKDEELKRLLAELHQSVQTMDATDDPPGQNHPSPPDVPEQTS